MVIILLLRNPNMKHLNPITSAQCQENSFISELESKFIEEDIKFIVELARQHYFNPCDTIAKYWCVEDILAEAETPITTEKALNCLAFLENLDDEHAMEYEAIEYILAKIS